MNYIHVYALNNSRPVYRNGPAEVVKPLNNGLEGGKNGYKAEKKLTTFCSKYIFVQSSLHDNKT